MPCPRNPFYPRRTCRGALKPAIDRSFSFEDIVDAHRYLESNQQIGKIVVTL
ncbi:zinc-binding dehydrogenase [Silvimonas amylolytica]|uniref:zinc-binding dehydrogenase n=1 Tax=Silvimonas amylolytica TaxID=449663 RepID=UPI001E46EE52|nr:zinc-binding dehydrogenase [Silvimonas amylolytica]